MQKISREFNFADASKLRKENSEIEFNSEILGENEEKMNTLCLFKENTIGKIVSLMFPIPEKFKSKNQNFFEKKFRGRPKNEKFRGN